MTKSLKVLPNKVFRFIQPTLITGYCLPIAQTSSHLPPHLQ
ncbi:Mobile element protein [Microcystis panniformis FACHB-1757]|uniref:Mobile element protein n=1 Tax=Microcystis panniformis FACHB-1757 TaxID=1638788 RepID=A0A0K1S3C1_9CHRO|nr:Mobile element protein [Microcystis panniformis FACHB-1757]